ncbi:MAG TPA: PilN domain-containing protein [Chthonomonadaceae bacterium]|nr:PilN domain-containing protein [Chthonomonadaceae bacterium]
MIQRAPVISPPALPRVDLHQERRAERRRLLRQSRRAALLLAILILAMGMALAPLTRRLIRLQSRLARTRQEAVALDQQDQVLTQASAQVDEQVGRWMRFLQGRNRRRAWKATLRDLAGRMPADVSLESLQMESKVQRTEATLQGSAERIETLRAFMDSLARSSRFTQLCLTETTAEDTSGSGGRHFRMTAYVSGPLANGAVGEAR